jgi:hypothetical protein
MHRAASRASRNITLGGALLLTCSLGTGAQDPPSSLQSDDPIMQALRERAVIAPIQPGRLSENPTQPSRRPTDRWRMAERLLRQARILERDAKSLEQLGDAEIADSLRQLAAKTREQVLRILQNIDKP